MENSNIWQDVAKKGQQPWTFQELATFLRQPGNLRDLVNTLEKVHGDDKVNMVDATLLSRVNLAVRTYSR